MDLRYSETDEAFRAELRDWLAREVPRHGPPPDNDDWPARRAYETAWQRKLHDAGLVARDKRGRWVHWTVRPESLAAVRAFLDLPATSGTCC